MAFKMKKFEKMIRGNPVPEQKSYEKQETINEIRFNELEALKQRIFVNSLSHIKDDDLRKKCSDISTHYRIFKDDESHYKIKEFSDDERYKFDKCIEECVQKECALIINEKESIPAGMQINESNCINNKHIYFFILILLFDYFCRFVKIN